MRKQLRDQLIEIIDTLWEGINYIAKADRNEAMVLLGDCYDASNIVLNAMESNLSKERFNEYRTWLGHLKEILEEIFESLSLQEKYRNSVFQEIEMQLGLIKSNLSNETEVRLEIAFMPYSASMWDCLESIWKAASEDPRCDCYVIPIPYYNRNSDHSFGKYNYEGKEFPVYVPIEDYRNYDIATRKPDIIYIHNPYDGNNYVTSVHPNFYSYELKKHSGMLVYVPYFVTNGTVPNGHYVVPAMSHVDKVIVQSEKLKEQHLEYIVPEKLVALGSPKIDRVLLYEENKPEIPEEWMRTIGDKKVVLFNTSLTALLTYGKTVIDKLKYVFSCFKDRNDVVLLWRPHPLSEDTIASMRPQILKEYYQLEEDFKEKKLGIYDDTPDVERAIAISDAYYGDGTSSLVHMYGITGKPIMIQDLIINREPSQEEIYSNWYGCSEFEGDYAWLVNGGYNGLSKVNIHTGKFEFFAEIPSEQRDGVYLFSNILKINDKLLLTPFNGKEIAIYDINSGEFEKHSINKDFVSQISNNLIKAIYYKNYIYITPFMYKAIIRYDVHTKKLKYYTDWYDHLKPYIHNNEKPLFANGVCVRGNVLLMAFAQDNLIMEFDMDTGDSKVHTVGCKGNNYWNMTFDGKDYWLIQNENNNNNESIVKWNYETGETVEYSDFPLGFNAVQHNFNEIVHCGNYLLAFPRHSNMIVRIDRSTGEMSEFKTNLGYKEGERRSEFDNQKCNYYFAKIYDDQFIVAMSMSDNSLIKIDVKTEEVLKITSNTPKIDMGSYIDFNKPFIPGQSISSFHYNESKYLTLNKLLNHITSNKYTLNNLQIEAYKGIVNNSDGTSGEKIHQYIIGNYD